MLDMKQEIDVRLLVHWLGVPGARSGLKDSRKCTVEILSHIAQELGMEPAKKATRGDLIEDIVHIASRRINRTLEQLYEMSQDELVKYLEDAQVEPEELLDLVKRLDLDPGRDGLQNLIRFVAREISETGRFMRIASKSPRDTAPHNEK